MKIVKQVKSRVVATLDPYRYEFRRMRYSDVYQRLLDPEQGNQIVGQFIEQSQPFIAGRFGSVELACVYRYLSRKSYKPVNLEQIHTHAGFFPVDQKNLDRFCELFLTAARQVDILGTWNPTGEGSVIRRYCPQTHLVPLASLEPYYHQHPWSAKLASKKVLVIHPFSDTILHNYQQHRKYLFKDSEVLPEFEIRVIKAVQSIAGNQVGFNSWFDAYDYMSEQICRQDFDIALIGCGAYGLPLAACVKSLGKQAIHLGGATQILFGIRGQRWDNQPFFQSLYNDYWVRPQSTEIPKNYQTVENGCYW